MDRRKFLTRSAALVAISALPLPQAQAAVEPKLASGLIEGLDFVIDEPITLILDGPIHFRNCTFTADMNGRSSVISLLDRDDPKDFGAMRIISPKNRYVMHVENCMLHAKGGPKAWPKSAVGFWIGGPTAP